MDNFPFLKLAEHYYLDKKQEVTPILFDIKSTHEDASRSNETNPFKPTVAGDLLNDIIARTEALKVRILGNAQLADHEKQELFHELDMLRGILLETNVNHGSNQIFPPVSPSTASGGYGSNPLVLEGIVGHNKSITRLLRVISKIAPSKLSVLLEGETGTGKELFARIVHLNSGRTKFVAVNCGAIPRTLIESELFGHIKGSFTGAYNERKGKFEDADGGTIFLDEIGDLDLDAQVKMLRILEEGELQRVGSEKNHQIDVRVITATNKNLEEMVSQGRFREDLYYRINICPLFIPPLRERKDEIELLLEFFLQEMALSTHQKIPELAPELRRFILEEYDFPGNIRELKNMAQYIVHIADKKQVTIRDLPRRYQRNLIHSVPDTISQTVDWESMHYQAGYNYLVTVLSRHKGKINQVCMQTGLSRARMYQLFKKFDLNPGDFRDSP